jgi:protoheme IX farnesyltransferase
VGNIYLFFKPSPRNAWLMFKLSSPYLFVLFAGMMADLWLR